MKNFKKILATVLAVLFVVSVAVVSVSAASSDSAWYKKAVEYLDGIGVSDIGSTGGEDVSRDEFVTWVAKIESHQLIESAWKNQEWIALSTFDDVGDSEHQGAIGYSIGRKFIVGNGDGTFSPHQAIKFGEAAAIVVRLMSYEHKVTGETWDEQVANYEFVANTFCGAFDNTFLSKTAQYDPNHKLTKGEAAYILYTIMNGAAWADDQITAEEEANLNLTSYGVDLGEFFATNGSATVKAQFVVAQVPITYSNTTQSFRRYDAYVTGATYDSLFADKLFQSNGLLDTSAGKNVKLQNVATGYYITLPASVFSTLVKKAAGHSASDDTTNALNYVEYGGVVTISTTKANKANLALTTNVNLANANTISKFTINDSLVADTYIGQSATTLANIKNGAQVTGWKFASAKAAAASAFARLTSTPATWTNVKYDANGVPTNGKLVVDGQTYTVVTTYTGKANEIKVFAPAEIFNGNTLVTSKVIPSVVGRVGDTVYAGGIFSAYERLILNLHRHVPADNIGSDVTYYTRSGAGTDEDPYVYTEVDLDTFVYEEGTKYYIQKDAGYTAATAADFTTTVTALTVAATTDQEYNPAKTYYVADAVAANTYNPATRADFDVAFKQGVEYYIYDGTDYVVNAAAYDVDTVYYLQDETTFETRVAELNDFAVEFAAGPYYEAAAATTADANATLYAEDETTGVLTVTNDAVTTTWKEGKTYYTQNGDDYVEVDTANTDYDANTAYFLAVDGVVYEEASPDDFSTYFKSGTKYYTAEAVDTTTDVDPEKVGTTYYKKYGATEYLVKTVEADFTVGFDANTLYYTYDDTNNTYPVVDTAAVDYDATVTYYVEKGGNNTGNDELRLATLADFAVAWTNGTTYYDVTEVNTANTAYQTGTTYYVEDTVNVGTAAAPINVDVLRKAVPTDFTVYFALAFEADTVYYEKTENGKYVATEDTEVDITKDYYIDGDYDEFLTAGDAYYTRTGEGTAASPYVYTAVNLDTFVYDPEVVYYTRTGAGTAASPYVYTAVADEDMLFKVKTTFEIEEDIPSWVTYELKTTGGAFVTNTSFNIVSEFVVDGMLDQMTVNTKKALTVAQALQLILGPAQGESNVVFSDTDGDGAYDIAVVTESSRALYYGEVNSSTDPAGEGYLGGNASATREIYDSFGNYITTAQGLKGHNVGGLVVDKEVGVGGASGGGTDGWNTTSTKSTNKVQIVVCMSNERQTYGGNNDTALYGVSNAFPYKTFDVANLTTGYIENVKSGTTKVGGVEVYQASVIKADGERTTVYIPVDPAEKITLSVTVDGVASDVTFAAGRSLLSFVADYDADNEIGEVAQQPGAWMAGHTVKYVAYENGVAWCMVDTAVEGAVVGYVAGVTKSDSGDNTYKVQVVASTSEATTTTNFAPTAQNIASVVTYGYGSAMVVNSFGIDAIFAEEGVLTVKAYKCTQDAINQFTTLTNSNMFQGISGNAPLTGIYYEGEPDGTKKPTLVGTGYVTSSTFNKAGIIISAYDYITYVRPAYQNATYWEEVEYDAHDLFGYIDWTTIGNKTASQTTTYIGGSVKTLEVKGAATAVWTYDAATYNLINRVLVKGILYDADWVSDGDVVSQYDLVYLSFTKDAGSYYTIDGMDDDSYEADVDTGDTDWGAIYMGNSAVFFTAGKLSSNYRTRASLAYRFPLLKTGAGHESMWTNVGEFDNQNILGYTKTSAAKTNIVGANNVVKGYYELYDMTIGEDPYYVRNIDAQGKITYTLYFTTVRTLSKVHGNFYYELDPSKTLLIALVNKATMKQEIDDGTSYTDSAKFYVDGNGYVWKVESDPVYDQTKVKSEKPEYEIVAETVAGALVEHDITLAEIKTDFGVDVKEEDIVSLQVAPYTEDEAGFVPGLYHVYLTNGLGTTKNFQMNQATKIVVIYPDSDTGNFNITVTTPKDLYANNATVFVTDYQYDGSATTCTMLSVFGKLNTPVQGVVDSNDTITSGARLVYLNSNATVVAEAIQLGDYWVIRSTEPAIDVTTGEEVGSIQFKFATYKEDEMTPASDALKAGGYFLINKDNEVISAVKEEAGTYGPTTGTDPQNIKVLTGVITNISADGSTKAIISGVKDVDLMKYKTKFIYHDMDNANFGIAGSSTNVSVSTMNEIKSTYSAEQAIVDEGVGIAPHFYTAADIAAAEETIAEAKASAVGSYFNGTFWNVEFSPLYNYFVSQRVSFQNRGDLTLTFNYVIINDVMYVFVNSFAK